MKAFNDTTHTLSSNEKLKSDNSLDPERIFYLLLSKLHFFAIALVLTLFCAFLYNRCTIPVYRVSASVLIDEEDNGMQIENNNVLQGFGLGSLSANLDNQTLILSSRTLIGRTLDELNYNIDFFRKGLFNSVSLYPEAPFSIVTGSFDSIPQNITFSLKLLDHDRFIVKAQSKDSVSLKAKAGFNENIVFPGGAFRIEADRGRSLSEYKKRKIYFISHSTQNLVESYRNRLSIQPASEDGTILILSLESTNVSKDLDFLNKLIEIYLTNSLDKKNEEAYRIIQFIDDQLIGISDSLIIAESRLQQFRSTHRVMDLSAQGQVIIEQAMNLENEKARLEIESNYYSYLAEYLAKDASSEIPIAPATIGITDPGLTRLVADLAELQSQLYSKSLGAKNPLQYQLNQRIRTTKEALRETLNGLMRANNLGKNEINEQIRTVNAQASALPVTERQLLGIERKFKLNDELYTFLLEKRAEAQIRKASNMPDNELIDGPEADILPIRPKKLLTFSIALLSGFVITFFWILIKDAFNNKILKNEDLKMMTDIPLIAYIPKNNFKMVKVVLKEPTSFIAESFRSLRSKMQYFAKGAENPIVLITSSMPEEGKTFTAINLASAYCLSGKKTILIDFDLRKPKLADEFELQNNMGISTWLFGKCELNQIINQTQYDNLSVISSGPIPPNPSELMALDKTKELLSYLKENYECIVMDSSPIGIVSDTYNIASFADTLILVVRQNFTFKNQLDHTINDMKFGNIKNISIVLNEFKPETGRFVYNTKYGYNTL